MYGKSIFEKVAVGVITTLVLGALALLWNWSSGGGLIRALGGVTQDDIARISGIPSGAVAAFDIREACPNGWKPFSKAIGRTVIGAGLPGAPDENNVDENGVKIAPPDFSKMGGRVETKLLAGNIPELPFRVPYRFSNTSASGGGLPLVRVLADSGGDAGSAYESKVGGGGAAFPNAMPYVALTYCRKE